MSSPNNPYADSDAEREARWKVADEVRQAFATLSLDQKIATLFRVELDMLGDAVNTVLSAASKAADKIVDTVTGCEASGSEPANGGSTAL
jgi:hypothetical protein